MLGELIRFEWRYHTRRATFAAAAAFFLLMGAALPATGYGPANVHLNSPYVITQSLGLLSLLSVFALTLFTANAGLRDAEHRMEELVYATPVGKLQFLTARFTGALLAAGAAFSVSAVGMALGTLLGGHDPARVGPVDVGDYLWALAVMALPNLLLVGTVLFGIAALTRSALATYVGGILVYVLYFACAALTNSPLMAASTPPTPEGLAVAALVDPLGLAAFFEQTRHWLPAERDAQHVALEGRFLLNRLLWSGVSALVLGLVYRLFSFRVAAGARTGREDARERALQARPAYRPVRPRAAQALALWTALLSATRVEFRSVLTSRPFLALVVLWTVLVGTEVVQGSTGGEYRTPLFPTTGLLLSNLQQPLTLFGLVVVVYFSAELVWRERTSPVADLLDVTPTSSAVFFLSKAAALALLLGVLVAVAVAAGVGFQQVRGVEGAVGDLVLGLLFFTGLPLLLFAFAALFLQTLSPNRHVGMLLNLLLGLVLVQGAAIGLEHPLLRFAGAPGVPYSDMNGFGPEAPSALWFLGYWSAGTALLALVTYGTWRRGREVGLTARVRRMARDRGRGGALVALACLLSFVALGGFLFHQANVVHGHETREQGLAWKADYERAYRHLEALPQPQVVGVRVNVDLFPEEGRYVVAGTYRLANRTASPLRTVWVAVHRDVPEVELSLPGATRTVRDARFGMHAFELERPLLPGAELDLSFRLATRATGVQADDFDHSVVENGSYLVGFRAFPTLGYRTTYALTDPAERRRRGLPTEARLPTPEEAARRGGGEAWVTFEATVSTSADQVALAPGRLLGEWREGGRRFFRYASEGPIRNAIGFVSGRYAVERVRHGGVDIEAYFHPAHRTNIPRMLKAAERSLSLFSTRFGPYPHRVLRLVEVPTYWSFGGFALPSLVLFSESRGYHADVSAPGTVDLVTKRVAHEVAHQWWGHQVDPLDAQGASAIVETLAKYSELMVLEDLYGEASMRQVRQYELDRYLDGRTGDGAAEPPLSRVEDQAYVYYAKGALVMAALQHLVGTEALDGALRRLVQEHTPPQRHATSLDLLAKLADVTPEPQRALVDSWMRDVVVDDVRVTAASMEPLPDGRFRVTMDVEAAKFALREGREVPLSLDEPLEVAAFTEHPDRILTGDTLLYRGTHPVPGGATTLSFVVDRRPAYVAVDPLVRRVDRDRMDNVRPVEERTPHAVAQQ